MRHVGMDVDPQLQCRVRVRVGGVGWGWRGGEDGEGAAPPALHRVCALRSAASSVMKESAPLPIQYLTCNGFVSVRAEGI